MFGYNKSTSIVKDICLRDIFGSQQYSWTAGKHIPSSLVEYFECPVTSSYQLESNNFEYVPPYACDFSMFPSEEHLALISKEDGSVMMLDTYNKNGRAVKDNWFAHSNAIYDIKWSRCDRHFLTASADQSICLHDAPTKKQLLRFFGHSSSVKTLSLHPQYSSVFASGSRDGTIRIWDSRNIKTTKVRGCEGVVSINKIENCHTPDWKSVPTTLRRKKIKQKGTIIGSVTSISYLNDGTIVSSGSTDGKIKFWDSRKLTSRGEASPRSILVYSGKSQKSIGYSNLMVNSKCNRLFAYCLDSVIYEYDLYSPSLLPVRQYAGHMATSFYLKQSLSPDDRFLVCGSSDSCAYIYPLEPSHCRPYLLRGHQTEVTVPCWNPNDPSKLITLSDDCCVFIWQMRPDRRYRLSERKELAGMTELSSNISINHSLNQSNQATPITMNANALLARSSARLSQKLRQVNINQFLTPSPQLKSPQSTANLIADRSAADGTPFSKIDSNPVVSPKRLLLSPRNLFPIDRCQSACLSQNSSSLPISTVLTSSAATSSSLVRKRLRFDFSNHEEPDCKTALAPLSDSSNILVKQDSTKRTFRRSSSHQDSHQTRSLQTLNKPPRKRKASDLDSEQSPGKSLPSHKRIKSDSENIAPFHETSPITPLSAKSSLPKLDRTVTADQNHTSPIPNLTPRSNKGGVKTPQSAGRRSRRIENNPKNVTPITNYFQRTSN